MKKKIISVAGARPNFMKIAPIAKAMKSYKDTIDHKICHTGQHFDEKMSKIFFEELSLPNPTFSLNIGSGTHAVQTAKIMIEFEKVLIKENPCLVLVVGDVNSTLACSLVASKMNIKVAHVESGLRSFDRYMPEEINRLVTDAISDYLFVSEESGVKNLINEGIDQSKIFFTGNVMIDTLVNLSKKIDQSSILANFSLTKKNYILTTFHRPSNVDSKKKLHEIIDCINYLSIKRKIIFPLHPRTENALKKNGLLNSIGENVIVTGPMGYIDFLSLTKNAELVITDSGGIQEETTFMGVQCITVRDSTERPITISEGTNSLVGTDISKVKFHSNEILNGKIKKGKKPELWDGKAAERISTIIYEKIL